MSLRRKDKVMQNGTETPGKAPPSLEVPQFIGGSPEKRVGPFHIPGCFCPDSSHGGVQPVWKLLRRDSLRVAPQLLSHVCMTLSAEALDILAYLKTDSGRFVSLPEISRRAGGRRRFEESPGWAKRLLPPLLEASLIEVNARGHYRFLAGSQPAALAKLTLPPAKFDAKIVGEDYFPTGEVHGIVDGNYFP